MENDDGDSNDGTLQPDSITVKTRTLFHYFKTDVVEEKKRKQSPDISVRLPPQKRAKEESAEVEIAKSVGVSGDEPNERETPKPKVKQINSFFSKISKDEYRKECEKQASVAVLTVTAMVHSPSPEPPIVAKNLNSSESKNKKVKKSNVSRSSRETDTITVVSIEENKFQPEDDNAVSGLNSSPVKEKVSPTFFRHNPCPPLHNEIEVKEVSIDDEFFMKMATKNECTGKKKKSVKAVSCEKKSLSVPIEKSILNVKCEEKIASVENASPVSTVSTKISSKLFGKKRNVERSSQPDEDSVDIDFSAVFSKGGPSSKILSDFKDVTTLQPIEKPKTQLFKVKPPKKKTKAAVMYDSDSIDLDVLASFNSKTFCGTDNNGFVTESDESCSSAIAALMKKPLSKPAERKKSPHQVPNAQISTKSLDICKAAVENNIFEKMMSTKQKNLNEPEVLARHDQDNSQRVRRIQPKARRKSLRKISELKDSDSSELEDEGSFKEKVRSRKKSGRRSSGNKENTLLGKDKSAKSLQGILEDTECDKFFKNPSNEKPEILPNNIFQVCAVGKVKLSKEEAKKELSTNAFQILMNGPKVNCQPVELCKLNLTVQAPETLVVETASSFLRNEEAVVTNPTEDDLKEKTSEPIQAGRRSSARIKTNLENARNRVPIYEDSDQSNDSSDVLKHKRKVKSLELEKNVSSPAKKKMKQSNKLAPIFSMGKKTIVNVVEDPEKVAARLAFLHSSVPESLKNQMASQSENPVVAAPVLFPLISHIRQIDPDDIFWSLPMKEFKFRKDEPFNVAAPQKIFRHYLKNLTHENTVCPTNIRLTKDAIYSCFKHLAAREPSSNFDVMKIFHRYIERKSESDQICEEAWTKNVSLIEIEEARQLRSRKRRSKVVNTPREVQYDPNYVSSMQWTMKYAPVEAGDVIGNVETMKKLQNWLREWEIRDKRKKVDKVSSSNSHSDSSSSDFTSSSDDDSEEESSSRVPNTALLLGPCGIGKTAAVYALAREMGFKVLEVNASNGRSGKQVLVNLREATQSHNVRKRRKSDGKKPSHLPKRKGNFFGSQGLISPNPMKKFDKTAVILFEDIDIVFEEADEGFYGAVNSLIATTKRPIIMTSSNPSFLKTSRSQQLKQTPQAFLFKPPDPLTIAKHLQLMALSEGYMVDLDCLKLLALLHGSNISKSIQALHFWVTCGVGVKYEMQKLTEVKEMYDDNLTCKIMGIDQTTPKPEIFEVSVLLNCHLRSVGVREDSVGALVKENSVLETVVENGLLDLLEYNFVNLLPLNKIPKPKYRTAKTEITSQNSTLPTEKEESREDLHVKSQRIKTSKEALESISSFLDVQSQFVMDQRDSPPWWSTSIPTETFFKTQAKSSDVIASILRGTIKQTQEELKKLSVPQAGDPTLLSIYSECKKLGEDADMVASSNEFKKKNLGLRNQSKVHTAQMNVLNNLLPELSLGVKKLTVDFLPVVRSIARFENQRKLDGLSSGGGKRSRSGRFVHYFSSQCISIKEQSLEKLCEGLM